MPAPFRPAFTLALMLSALLLLVGVDLLWHDDIAAIFAETHAIELMTVAFFLFAALLLWRRRADPDIRASWHLPVILILMALRELDLDKRLTSDGVLQLRLYSGDAPWAEKVIGAAVIGLILICAARLLWHSLPGWWRGLRAGRETAWLVGAAAAAIVLAKGLDGIGRKLSAWGFALDPDKGVTLGRAEELLELIAAMLLVQAVAYFRLAPRLGRLLPA